MTPRLHRRNFLQTATALGAAANEAKQRIEHLEKIIRGIFEKRDVEDLLRDMFEQ